MTDPDIASALRDRVRDEQPDLQHLTAVSLREGARIKRRRTAGIVAGVGTGFALVAGTALMASGLPGGGSGPAAELAPAVGASAEPAPEQDCVPAPAGGLPVEAGKDADKEHADPDFLTDVEMRSLCGEDQAEGNAGEHDRVSPQEDLQPLQTTPQLPDSADELPFTLDVDGWSCEAPVTDKVACASATGVVTLIVRPASQHDAWANDPDKGNVWISPVQDGWFVSVQGDLGDTPLDQFVDGLRFADDPPDQG